MPYPCPVCDCEPQLSIEWIAPKLYVKYVCRKWLGLRLCFGDHRPSGFPAHRTISSAICHAADLWNEAVVKFKSRK